MVVEEACTGYNSNTYTVVPEVGVNSNIDACGCHAGVTCRVNTTLLYSSLIDILQLCDNGINQVLLIILDVGILKILYTGERTVEVVSEAA